MANKYVIETVRCAGPGCDAVRKEANHWFLCVDDGDLFFCRKFGKKIEDEESPVCGQACAQKLFEQWLQKTST